ncbi:hypothetical protein N431DRAFT_177817 [Stipitochalara longipes BDJ]|nr:hypothetical protein N431DRAFT_177817 [Stipitochalara longipes BDJ]
MWGVSRPSYLFSPQRIILTRREGRLALRKPPNSSQRCSGVAVAWSGSVGSLVGSWPKSHCLAKVKRAPFVSWETCSMRISNDAPFALLGISNTFYRSLEASLKNI